MSTRTCLVCGWPAATVEPAGGGKVLVECRVCGRFTLTSGLAGRLQYEPAVFTEWLSALAVYLRQANDAGLEPALGSDNWQACAQSVRAQHPARKIRRLLELLGEASVPAGARLHYYHPDSQRPTARLLLQRRTGAESEPELNFLLQALVEAGDVLAMDGTENVPPRWGDATMTRPLLVTAKGWAKLEAANAVGVVGRCFIAMSFAAALAPVYNDGIKPAIDEDCGLEPRRVDRIEHVERIDDRIIAEIRQAQCCVADLTDARGGVYFEAGFALGLNRIVIWTCQRDDLQKLHFDTRQYNFIDWADTADLRVRLTNRLRALGLSRKPWK